MSSLNQPKQSPAELARETFRQLASLRVQPTPEAYSRVYHEIAGTIPDNAPSGIARTKTDTTETILTDLASSLIQGRKDYAEIGKRLQSSAKNQDWQEYHDYLICFIDKIFTQAITNDTLTATVAANAAAASAATNTLTSLTTPDDAQAVLFKDLLTRTLTLALPNLLSATPELASEAEELAGALQQTSNEHAILKLAARLKNLCFKIENLPTTAPAGPVVAALPENPSVPVVNPMVEMLSNLLSLTLSMAVSSLLKNNPELAQASDQLSEEIKFIESKFALQGIESRLKSLVFQITLNADDSNEQLHLLLSLFNLLLENVSNLLEDDNWLRGQVLVIKQLIAGHIDHRSLIEATRSLKEVIYKQGELKDCIAQNRVSLKHMMDLFVERLSLFADTTGNYHKKISAYSNQISQISGATEVNLVLESVLADTKNMQQETKKSHILMISAQKEVRDAEARINELEQKIAEMSEQVHKDQLTGSLNRRGLDEVFEREAARADRRGTPLCVGLLDLDNFKRINDAHGHATGDEALMHLVKVVKNTLRSIDAIARYGGEEFIIIMPETTLRDAADTMVRVQRELTKHFFMVRDHRLLITFSAGVTVRSPFEMQDSVIKRADKAMYAAKKAGKNQVVIAEANDETIAPPAAAKKQQLLNPTSP